MTDTRRVNRLLKWLDKQRLSHLDMVTDAGDSSMWCKEEAELIRDHMKTVETMRREIEELDFLRHEGGPQSVAALEMAADEWPNARVEGGLATAAVLAYADRIRSIDPAEVLAKVGGCNIDPEVECETLMADEVARRIAAGDYLVITDDGDIRRQRDIDAAEGADQDGRVIQ